MQMWQPKMSIKMNMAFSSGALKWMILKTQTKTAKSHHAN